MWNQIQQLRAPVDDLRSHDPSLVSRFLQVAHELERSGSRQVELITFSQETMAKMIAAQDKATQHVELAKEWTRLLEEIRLLPDFSNFLRPSTASSILAGLPCDGPVVILNIHEDRCDALALVSGADVPLHIPLQSFSLQRAVKLGDDLRKYLERQRVRIRAGDRYGQPFIDPTKNILVEGVLHRVLRDLWEHVVKPVLDALGYKNPVSSLLVCVTTCQ